MMKKIMALLLAAFLMIGTACVAGAESAAPNPGWNLPETIEMTEELTAVFENGMKGLMGVKYEPLGFLGEKDGVYCFLCRATVVYPGAEPYYTLVYVNAEGVLNIWEIWMDAHAQKE